MPISAVTRSWISSREPRRWIRSGSPMISPTGMRGFSDENGSWKIIWMCGRRAPERSALEPVHPHRPVADPEKDLAARGLERPQDEPGRGRLPAAALPDEAQGLPLRDVEAHPLHGHDGPDLPPREAGQPGLVTGGSAS